MPFMCCHQHKHSGRKGDLVHCLQWNHGSCHDVTTLPLWSLLACLRGPGSTSHICWFTPGHLAEISQVIVFKKLEQSSLQGVLQADTVYSLNHLHLWHTSHSWAVSCWCVHNTFSQCHMTAKPVGFETILPLSVVFWKNKKITQLKKLNSAVCIVCRQCIWILSLSLLKIPGFILIHQIRP